MCSKLTLVWLNLMEQEGLAAHFGTTVPEHPDDILFLPYRLDEIRHPARSAHGVLVCFTQLRPAWYD
ncbi:hypothetical protein [Cognatiyoonia sp.]|uniref:hypothetical protein n=1 Tax=Cognatiyoonia sp. TaxID=2211652 RepID=UPI003F69D4FE